MIIYGINDTEKFGENDTENSGIDKSKSECHH